MVSVKDEDGNNISGAKVTILETSFLTENGYTTFGNLELNEDFVGVKVENSNYISVVKNFTPSETGVNTLKVVLFKGVSKSVDASVGGKLVYESGVELNFSVSSFTNNKGEDYTGDVFVSLYYHTPNDDNYLNSQPGALVGLDDSNTLSALATEGMIFC